MENLKKHKSVIIVGALVLLFTCVFFLGTVYVQYRTGNVVQAQSKEVETTEEAAGISENKEAEKREQAEVSMEMAKHILEEIPDAPLLQGNAKEDWGDSSLENYVNDINAVSAVDTRGARKVIIKVCETAGIDANTAKVRDLTAEQIAQIDEEVFENSDHPED